jgi:NAD(P)-dependent dehydrogenase (short-subunit alcohol dehydrogenase family)
MARNLAVEFGPHAIRANAVAPGLIETPFSRALMRDEAFIRRRLVATPLRRIGQPSEIAATVLWLVSPGGAFTTGQTIVVDGGPSSSAIGADPPLGTPLWRAARVLPTAAFRGTSD